MANPVWDGLITYAHFGGAQGSSGQNSSSFNIPQCTGAVTFIVPALDGAAETLALQGLSPLDKETWVAVSAYNPADGTSELVDGIAESSYTVVPASALGTGTFRFVSSATNQTTASQVVIIIDRI